MVVDLKYGVFKMNTIFCSSCERDKVDEGSVLVGDKWLCLSCVRRELAHQLYIRTRSLHYHEKCIALESLLKDIEREIFNKDNDPADIIDNVYNILSSSTLL